jgi:hypothetical protein
MCKLIGFREHKIRNEGFNQTGIENPTAHWCPMTSSLIPEVLLFRLFMMVLFN